MAYDSVRHRTVLFGGYRAGETTPNLADTWEWDGTTWLNIAATGPSARGGHSMVYDSAHQEIILFGGVDSSGYLGDTWAWDGGTWSPRSFSGPTSDLAGMAFDGPRGVAVHFGGRNGGTLSETWEWSSSSWTRRLPITAVTSRYGPGMVYDTGLGRTVMFGGYTYSTNQNLADTWTWDGLDWKQPPVAQSPPARSSHVMAYDEGRDRIVLFSGSSGATWSTDTWEWDGGTWTNVTPSISPRPTQASAMAFDRDRQLTVLVPGSNVAFDAGTLPTDAGVDAGTGFSCTYTTCFNCASTPGSESITLAFSPGVTDTQQYIFSPDSYALETLFNTTQPTNYFSRDTTTSSSWHEVTHTWPGGVTELDAGTYGLNFNATRTGSPPSSCPTCYLISLSCTGIGPVQ
jgi:hypothetical protein